jgi:arylsulfatase A-like enzyme
MVAEDLKGGFAMRRYRWGGLLFVLLLMGQFTIGAAQERPDGPPRNIILIGWDGVQREHLREAMARNEMPHLQQLCAGGSLVAIDILRETETCPGWAQILTGYEPEVTGVYSNSRYQSIPKGYTIFERLKQARGRDGIATAMVVPNGHYLGVDPQREKEVFGDPETLKAAAKKAGGFIRVENGRTFQVIPGEPYYYAREGLDIFAAGKSVNNETGRAVLDTLKKLKDRSFFLFVHFGDVDHQGHAYGENSREYNEALIDNDRWLGLIVAKLKESGLYSQTLIYVTSDHGFDEGMKTHYNAPYIFLGSNDARVVRRGLRTDITPTLLERFGVDITRFQPPLDGHSLLRPFEAPKW